MSVYLNSLQTKRSAIEAQEISPLRAKDGLILYNF